MRAVGRTDLLDLVNVGVVAALKSGEANQPRCRARCFFWMSTTPMFTFYFAHSCYDVLSMFGKTVTHHAPVSGDVAPPFPQKESRSV